MSRENIGGIRSDKRKELEEAERAKESRFPIESVREAFPDLEIFQSNVEPMENLYDAPKPLDVPVTARLEAVRTQLDAIQNVRRGA